jgi:hypothetical protein
VKTGHTTDGVHIATGALRLAQVIALLACVQISGVTNVVSDLLVAVGLVAAHAEECADDAQDAECPPGCPLCHCFHCGMSSLPAFAGDLLLEPKSQERGPSPATVTAPNGPDLPSVYRPPRSSLRS